ncbi:MAG: Hpt domain-containing protein [Synergistaceae bacterium]|jgi:two-component system chemotaxis sensor kinase CheA|nr:Hpt domain-containing protein [Synergistaceae bacterium]
MADMDMNQYMGAFLDEAGDNLAHLNELLLSAEQNQSDMDIINEIFRVAHTFKGMSATMGFQVMAKLTHSMEDLLGLVRAGTLVLTSDDVDVLFKCLDTLTAMVDAIRNGGGDQDVPSDELINVLHVRRDHPGAVELPASAAPAEKKPKTPAKGEPGEPVGVDGDSLDLTDQERDWITSATGAGMLVYELKVTLEESCMLRAARAYMIVTVVGDNGDIIKAEPSVEDLEKEAFERSFTLYVASSNPIETFTGQISKIGEVAEVVGIEVTLPSPSATGAQPDEAAKTDRDADFEDPGLTESVHQRQQQHDEQAGYLAEKLDYAPLKGAYVDDFG